MSGRFPAATRCAAISCAAILLAALAAAAQPAAPPPPGKVIVPLMGKRLFGPEGEELGRLVDLVADAEGRPIAAVVDVGGFMGLGSRRVALAWSVLRFRREADMVRMSTGLAPDRVTAAPEFRADDPATIFDPAAQP